MRLGIMLRNMGPQSTPSILRNCAARAEAVGLDDLWVLDHLAIPPDQSEGSGGRYLDPLATLAFLAGITERIGLGVSVLIAPYRPPLPTAKWVASIQELSDGRLNLGLGVGWMDAEFKALGVPRAKRGALTDDLLDFLQTCFANDVVTANGQDFIFKPRPARPPFLLGGAAEHAFERIVRGGDGWMPNTGDAGKLRAPVAELRQRCAEAGRPVPQIIPLAGLPLDDMAKARDQLSALVEIGVTGIIHAGRYADEAGFAAIAASLAALREA